MDLNRPIFDCIQGSISIRLRPRCALQNELSET
jgi:hypothetical protein